MIFSPKVRKKFRKNRHIWLRYSRMDQEKLLKTAFKNFEMI